MKRRSLILLVMVAAMCFVTGCTKDRYLNKKVAIIFPSNASARWSTEYVLLTDAIKNAGFSFYGARVDSEDKMIEKLASFSKDNFKTLVLVSVNTDSEKASAALRTLRAEGIKVICYDRLQQNTSEVDYYISASNTKVGQLFAAEIENLPRGSKIEMLCGPVVDKNALEVYNGLWGKIGDKITDGTWSVPSGCSTYVATALPSLELAAATSRMTTLLNDVYKDGTLPDAIICGTDTFAQGVVQVLQDNGKTTFPIILGQDNTAASQVLVKTGKQTMTIDKNPEGYVAATVSLLKDLADGKTISTSGVKNNGLIDVPFIEITMTVMHKEDYK